MRILVLGKPEPGGSKRAFATKNGKQVVVDANKNASPWKHEVANVALAVRGHQPPLDGPVAVHVRFYLSRPKGHYGTGRNAQRLKPSAPAYPTGKPDATKLWRPVEDALTTARIWVDDAQVVDQRVEKLYAEIDQPERCEIVISSKEMRSESTSKSVNVGSREGGSTELLQR